jgi:hypothetical protein
MLHAILKEPPEVLRNIKTVLHKIGTALMGAQEISTQEAVYTLLGLSLRCATRDVKFLNTNPSHERILMLKSKADLKLMPPRSKEVYEAYAALDKYLSREDQYEDCSFAHMMSWYEPLKTRAPNGKTMYRKRKSQRIIRFVGYSARNHLQDYMRESVLLFLPFRSEEIIEHTYATLFHLHEERIQAERLTFNKFQQDTNESIDEVLQRAMQDQEERETNFAPTSTNAEEDIAAPGQATARSSSISRMVMQEVNEYHNIMRSLNPEQKALVDHVLIHVRDKPREQLKIFLTGGAGVGKSVVVNALRRSLTWHYSSYRGVDGSTLKVLVLAYTGIAATHVQGATIHSALKIPLDADGNPDELSREKLVSLQAEFHDVHGVIFDEVSQISSRVFTWADFRLRQIKGNNLPCGGLHIFLVGDLYQLPPVGGRPMFEGEPGNINRLTLTVWDEASYYELKTIMRQQRFHEFAMHLNKVRKCHIDASTAAYFGNMVHTHLPDIIPAGTAYKHLFYMNSDCDAFNKSMFDDAPGEKHTIEGNIELQVTNVNRKRQRAYAGHASTSRQKTNNAKDDTFGGFAQVLHLYKGQHVQLASNIDVNDGLANGSNGTIEHFTLTPAGNVHIVWISFQPNTVGAMYRNTKHEHYRKDARAQRSWTPITREKRTYNKKGTMMAQTIVQFPLKEAEAITIHKSQGLTLDMGVIDFRGCNKAHLHYVALSRFRDPSLVKITNFDATKIRVNPLVHSELERKEREQPVLLNHTPLHMLEKCKYPLSIFCQNIRSFPKYNNFFRTPGRFDLLDYLCLTETRHFTMEDTDIQGFPTSFSAHNTTLLNHHGVLFYTKHLVLRHQSINEKYFQAVLVEVLHNNTTPLVFVVIYRSPSIPSHAQDAVWQHIEHVVRNFHTNFHTQVCLCGDLNIDITVQVPKLCSFFAENNMQQLIEKPTTIRNSSIDHFWSNNITLPLTAEIQTSYYSDHFPLLLYSRRET